MTGDTGFYIPQIPLWVSVGFLGIAVVAALWRGGLEERVTAAVATFPLVNSYVPGLEWSNNLPTHVGSFAICLGLALRSRRYWTLWAAAATGLSVVTDALEFSIGLTSWAYSSALVAWFHVLVGALLVGALTRRRGAA